MSRATLLFVLMAGCFGSIAGLAIGQQASPAPVAKAADSTAQEETFRIEGEKRFRANCGRCHQAPHHFPPRMMATIISHMRVRATLTDEDMRVILKYMEQ